jgi:RCC1 and BTB domain-containing protein
VLVNSDGLLYVTGSLLHDKLGLDKDVTNIFKFQVQPYLQSMKVKQVACGAYHTLALIENGDVYSWGGTLWGKTGQKSGRVSQVHTLGHHRVIEIACGDFHSLALSDKGDVFSWGGGGTSKNKGQLGHSNLKDLENPEQIQFFRGKKVKNIACGDYHTMALTLEDELYAWGEGNCGQLGTGGKDDVHTPKRININFNNSLLLNDYSSRDSGKEKPRIHQISLGGKHSLLLTNKGHLYVCGYGSQGQLGIGKTENVTEPTLVASLVGK